jgi:hypothetical protein
VYDEFIVCQDKIIHAIKDWFQNAYSSDIIKIQVDKIESIAEILLYMSDGIAFHLIDRPNKLKDAQMWNNFKKIIIDLLDK